MARDLPPFVDERVLSDAERDALDALLPVGEQTGDSRRDLVMATQSVVRRMRQHEEDIANAGAVINALYRDVRSWRKIQDLTGLSFTTARHRRTRFLLMNNIEDETEDEAVDTVA